MLFCTKNRIFLFLFCVFVQAHEEKYVEAITTKKFYISLDQANFFQAFVHCKQGGMELASIENEDESAALNNFLDHYKIAGTANGFWLSGTHLINASSFQYFWLSTGARAIFTNWVPGQPDNSAGREHCLQWVYNNVTEEIIGWNDWICENPARYVCEHLSN